jgi:RNA polymerase sigma-70 factor, ECF subfamily
MPPRSAHPTLSSPSTSPKRAIVATTAKQLHAGLVTLIPELRGRAMRLTGNAATAEDVVQDTIERALRFADQYERGTNMRAWVFQILFSVFVTRYRRSRREKNALRVLASDPCAWTLPESFSAPDATAQLTPATQKKLETLPAGFRSVVVLVDIEEHSYREAAEELGVPVGTVMSRLHRGRKMLASKMAAAA